MKLKLDLHEIFNKGQDIDRALRRNHGRGGVEEGNPRRDHPRQGVGAAQEAGAAVPRPDPPDRGAPTVREPPRSSPG